MGVAQGCLFERLRQLTLDVGQLRVLLQGIRRRLPSNYWYVVVAILPWMVLIVHVIPLLEAILAHLILQILIPKVLMQARDL